MAAQEKVKIGIVGGGIAGLSLLSGLCKYPHLDPHLYEASPKIAGDEGANVGLSSNALSAMELIDPSIRKALDLAGAVKQMPSARMYMGTGPEYGEFCMAISDKEPQHVVLRAALIRELEKTVDSNAVHAGKKLVKIEEGEKIKLHFADETSEDFDAIIGCDGIHSNVRKHILGSDHPAAEPVFSGLYNYMKLVTFEEATAKLGTDKFEPAIQTEWLKQNGLILHDVCNDGQNVMIVVAGWSNGEWDPAAWVRPASSEELKKDLEGYGEIAKGVYELLDRPDLILASVWEHLDAPYYNRGNVCIMGDAAHAFTPFMGAGAGQACEDSLTLYKLLGQARNSAQCAEAFSIYDKVRRERSQFIGKLSKGTGKIQFGHSEAGLDKNKLREKLEHRWDHILKVDLAKINEDAVHQLQEAIQV